MGDETAMIRGRVTIRPWRVGVLVDTNSSREVRRAIANLSSVWGGMSMPIFDVNVTIDELQQLGRAFDIDSLYADVREGPLGELLRKPGWAWRGGGPWGPFGGEKDHGVRKGLLPTEAIVTPETRVVMPTWDEEHPLDLLFSALWGVPTSSRFGCEHAPVDQFLRNDRFDGGIVGLLEAGMLRVSAESPSESLGGGVMVVRPDHPSDVVSFWNRRAFGHCVVAVPSDTDLVLAQFQLTPSLPRQARGSSDTTALREVVDVHGLEHATREVAELIHDAANRDRLLLEEPGSSWTPLFQCNGVTTNFSRSFRAEFRSDARWVDVDMPDFPLTESTTTHPLARGIVAGEFEVREIRGQDPRFTAQIPPYRRHAELIEYQPFMDNADHVRVGHNGIIVGFDAHTEDLRLPFVYNLDAMSLLFGEGARAKQSDVGRFQTRASEKFGGPFSGVFNQPGVRSAVALAARRPTGVGLAHLRGVVERDREGWPDALMERNVSPRDYAIQAVNKLLYAGLFVPTLKTHCSHCRVETHVSADLLASVMHCEFCGREYSLALSNSLTDPGWRYRLAAHLRPDQIEALMPALATTTLLAQLRPSHLQAPPVLGLEMVLNGKAVEVDVACFLHSPDWLMVLGEVKTGNRIDAEDVQNLELLRNHLVDLDVRCVLLFATLKTRFSPEETALLRGAVERSNWTRTARGSRVPNVPLVLTGADLSRTFWDEEHPWRWKNGGAGPFDTAMASCERNLGLKGWEARPEPQGGDFTFDWAAANQ